MFSSYLSFSRVLRPSLLGKFTHSSLTLKSMSAAPGPSSSGPARGLQSTGPGPDGRARVRRVSIEGNIGTIHVQL